MYKTTGSAPLPQTPESEIMQWENRTYEILKENKLTLEVATWLSVLQSQLLRLNNRMIDVEHVLSFGLEKREPDVKLSPSARKAKVSKRPG